MNRISFLNRGYAFKGLLAVAEGLQKLNKTTSDFFICFVEAYITSSWVLYI